MGSMNKAAATAAILLMLVSQNGKADSLINKNGMIAGAGALAFMAYASCNTAHADYLDAEPDAQQFCLDGLKGIKSSTSYRTFARDTAASASNLRKLKQNLQVEAVASGMPPEPPEGCAAHHIVPQKEGRPWAKKAADKAREILKSCKIDINSAENGVYLPTRNDGTSQCSGSYHPSLHTKNYYDSIRLRLADAKSADGCAGVKNALRLIKDELSSGVL